MQGRWWARGSLVRQKLRAVVAGTLLLAGCAVTDPQLKAEVRRPPAGGALLYVYRPQTLIGIANMDVPIMHLDKHRLARIRIGGYLAVPVSPGQHTLTTTESLLGSDTGKVRGETRFSVSAGSTLYLRYTESFKSFAAIPNPSGVVVESTGAFRFEVVPEAEARAEIADTKPLEVEKENR
jgi:uncharacterized protein DUF2846